MSYMTKAERTYLGVRASLDQGKDIKLNERGKRQVHAISRNPIASLRASFVEFKRTVKS